MMPLGLLGLRSIFVSKIRAPVSPLPFVFSLFFLLGPSSSLGGEFYYKTDDGVPTYTNLTPRDAKGYKRVTVWGIGKRPPSPGAFTYSSIYDQHIRKTASFYHLDPNLIKAIIKVESNFNRDAVSKKGAMGVMQLMPGTARDHGVRNPFDPAENIMGGSEYLGELMEMFDNNLELVLAAYNAGENAVIEYGYKIPPFSETRQYVRKVIYHYNYLKRSKDHRI